VTMAVNEPMLSAVHAGTPILQIRDLRTNLLILTSLSLSTGECIAVQGPSGAGKTLLLRAIAALEKATAVNTMVDRSACNIVAIVFWCPVRLAARPLPIGDAPPMPLAFAGSFKAVLRVRRSSPTRCGTRLVIFVDCRGRQATRGDGYQSPGQGTRYEVS